MKRNTLMLGALAATLTATGYLALQPDGEAPVAALPATRRLPAAPAGSQPPARLANPAAYRQPEHPRSEGWTALSPAALAAWAPPVTPQRVLPPPSAASGDPAKPRPPAFPYRWIGLLMQDGQATALLDSSQRSLGVQAGQELDQRWRVVRISADRIDLIWLPTGEALTLDKR